jgi:hypothetical protein
MMKSFRENCQPGFADANVLISCAPAGADGEEARGQEIAIPLRASCRWIGKGVFRGKSVICRIDFVVAVCGTGFVLREFRSHRGDGYG